jgi:hypothetical protein
MSEDLLNENAYEWESVMFNILYKFNVFTF